MWSTYTCILSAIDTLHSKTPQFESKRLVEYIYHVDSNQKRPGLPILVLGKIDFKTKNRERDTHTHKRMERRILYNGKRNNTSRRYNSYKHTCT